MATDKDIPHAVTMDDDTLIMTALRRYATACGVDGYHARGPIERNELRRRHDRALHLAAEHKRSLGRDRRVDRAMRARTGPH